MLSYQTLYLHILCTYLESKLKSMNNQLIQMKREKHFVRINEILYSFDALFREINEYNITYWSKYLFIIWIFLGSLISLLIFMIIFIKIDFVIKFVLSYSLLMWMVIFNSMISKVCSLNSEANKSYNIFHSFYVEFSDRRPISRIPQLISRSTLFKVLILLFCYQDENDDISS